MNLILRLKTLLDSILIERLPMPDNCSADIYALMTSCWNVNPLSRPTAAQIRLRLDRSIKNEVLSLPRVSSTKIQKLLNNQIKGTQTTKTNHGESVAGDVLW